MLWRLKFLKLQLRWKIGLLFSEIWSHCRHERLPWYFKIFKTIWLQHSSQQKYSYLKKRGPLKNEELNSRQTTNTNKSFSWQIFFRNFVWQISDHDLTSFNFGFFLKKFAAWFSINRLATIQQRASRQVTSRQPFKKPIYKHYQENNIAWLLDGPFLGLKIAFLTKQVTQPIWTVPTYILTIPRNS